MPSGWYCSPAQLRTLTSQLGRKTCHVPSAVGGKGDDLSDFKTAVVLEAVTGKYGRGSAEIWDFNSKTSDTTARGGTRDVKQVGTLTPVGDRCVKTLSPYNLP